MYYDTVLCIRISHICIRGHQLRRRRRRRRSLAASAPENAIGSPSHTPRPRAKHQARAQPLKNRVSRDGGRAQGFRTRDGFSAAASRGCRHRSACFGGFRPDDASVRRANNTRTTFLALNFFRFASHNMTARSEFRDVGSGSRLWFILTVYLDFAAYFMNVVRTVWLVRQRGCVWTGPVLRLMSFPRSTLTSLVCSEFTCRQVKMYLYDSVD